MRKYFVVTRVVAICAIYAIASVKCSGSIFKEFAAHGGSVLKDGSKVGLRFLCVENVIDESVHRSHI